MWHTLTTDDGLASNAVGSIAINPTTGDRWFGTIAAGVSRLDLAGQWRTFTTDDGIASNHIAAITIDPAKGDRWFGSADGAGVSRLDTAGLWHTFTTADGLANNYVHEIAIDSATGDRWFGSDGYSDQGPGLSRLDKAGQWRSFNTDDGLADNNIMAIAVDPATGDRWFGAWGGVSRLDSAGQWHTFTMADGLASRFPSAIAIDPNTGDRWFGSWQEQREDGSDVGLSRLDAAGLWRTFTTADGLADNRVTVITIDPKTGDRWFATWGRGVSRLDAAGRWRSFTTDDGLSINDVRAIAVDPTTGDRWFGGVGGVSRLNGAGEWRTYTTADGLASNWVYDISVDPATGDRWFGTEGGVSRFAPLPSVAPTDTSHTPTATPPPTATATPHPPRPVYLPLLLRDNSCPPLNIFTDVVLVIDASTSMLQPTSGGRTKMAAALAAARAFVNGGPTGMLRLRPGGDQVAIVAFNDQAQLVQPLTANPADLLRALAEVRTGQFSRIELGIATASFELLGPRRNPEHTPAIVVLSDGIANPVPGEATLRAAQQAREAGILVYVIGVGPTMNETVLRQMASSPDRFWKAPDAEALEEIYRQLVIEVQCPKEIYWGRR
jgi:hypothetical protein